MRNYGSSARFRIDNLKGLANGLSVEFFGFVDETLKANLHAKTHTYCFAGNS